MKQKLSGRDSDLRRTLNKNEKEQVKNGEYEERQDLLVFLNYGVFSF